MTMIASHASSEVIDAIKPDLEAFTSLWTALRLNYEGTNITRTVARLLHMYQPEEGVIAYERLLRTLFVLLEDFDSDGLQLLVSMVPPPKGVSEESVKEVFKRATGFVRIDVPIFHEHTDYITCTNANVPNVDFSCPHNDSQSTISTKSENVFIGERLHAPETEENSNPLTQTDNIGQQNRKDKSPQSIPPESSSEVFRGFAPSEIFNTQNHVQSIKNLYRPLGTYVLPQSGGVGGGRGCGRGGTGQNFVNFGQIVGQNSGQIQQPAASGLVANSYRPKWFQNPCHIMQKHSYPVNQYQDFYFKTVNNQYVKVPASKVNSFHQDNINTSRTSYQNFYTNTHDYLRNRSNYTVTSGLLEKIQQHRGLQEVAINKILTDCEASKTSEINTTPANVQLTIINEGENETHKNLNVKKDNTENWGLKIINSSKSNDETASKTPNSIENNDLTEFNLNERNSVLSRKTFEDFAREVKMRQRAIQEDIFKMDVVRSDEFDEDFLPGVKEQDDNPINEEILTASEGLMNTCKKFMDRAKTREQTEQISEVPVFPKTRSLSEIHEKSGVTYLPESNLWRLLTSKNVSESKPATPAQDLTESRVEPEDPLMQESRELSEPASSIPKRVVRRKRAEVSSARSKNQKVLPKGTINHVINLQDDLNFLEREIRAKQNAMMENNLQSESETVSRCSPPGAAQTSSPTITPATTLAELAAYKKQYYDALLSIRKEKAAVANSLAISSMGSSPAGFDPYYYSYLQHQHRQILQRHQRQLLMGHQFPQQQSMSAMANPWFRNTDWRYPVISQARLPQRAQMLHPSSSMWPPGVGFMGPDSQIPVAHNLRPQSAVSQVSKTPIRRRKLEEIVGKLKETESGAMSGSNQNEVQNHN